MKHVSFNPMIILILSVSRASLFFLLTFISIPPLSSIYLVKWVWSSFHFFHPLPPPLPTLLLPFFLLFSFLIYPRALKSVCVFEWKYIGNLFGFYRARTEKMQELQYSTKNLLRQDDEKGNVWNSEGWKVFRNSLPT